MTAKRKAYISISWILVAACMCIIFYMSSQPADESGEMSNSVISFLLNTFHINASSFLVRKAAHMLEFMGLALLIFNAVYSTFKAKYTWIFAWGGATLYAVTDEIHQLFVDGRACQFRDMLIDSSGALLGVITGIIILKIINIFMKRGKDNGDTETF